MRRETDEQNGATMVESCIPVIPSADIERSLTFWVDGLGLSVTRPLRVDGRLVGCMVENDQVHFWLNQRAGSPSKPPDYEGLRLYWTPKDLQALRQRLLDLGFDVSKTVERDYGQSEFFVTDHDGYSHCFGAAIRREDAM